MTRLAARMTIRIAATIVLLLALAARADAVTLNHLSDITFGTVTNLTVDQVQAESVCAGGLVGGTYSITATGTATGGAFALSGGGGSLPYDVQWASTSGQTTGTPLSSGVPLTGLPAGPLNCLLGLNSNASLIVVLRATALGAATQGSYSGMLQLLLAPN